MLLEQHPDAKIKSIRAKEIVKRIPLKIVWLGTISVLFVFFAIIGGMCFIKIEPSIKAHTVLIIKSSKEVSGYIFLPEEFIPKQQDTITSKIFIEGHVFSWGHAILNRKELYVEGENRFWKIPLVMEDSSSIYERLIDGRMSVKGEKQSIFRWIVNRKFKSVPEARR